MEFLLENLKELIDRNGRTCASSGTRRSAAPLRLVVRNKRMKILLTVVLFFQVVVSVAASEALKEGIYYFDSDILTPGICDLVKTNDTYRLIHQERHNTVINLVQHRNKTLKIFDTQLPGQEYWISVSGSASPKDDGSYSGKIKTAYHYFPVSPGKVNKGTWTLREATQEEVTAWKRKKESKIRGF